MDMINQYILQVIKWLKINIKKFEDRKLSFYSFFIFLEALLLLYVDILKF